MRILRFSFKNEPLWMAIFSLAPLSVALLVVLLLRLLR